jgi:hypothetical protein
MNARTPGHPPLPRADRFEARNLDAFECAMIQFFLAWAPYGDPPEEDCLPLFGKTVSALKEEMRTLVATPRCCSPGDRALLMRVARVLGAAAPGNDGREEPQP